MTTYVIEKGLPVPPPGRGRGSGESYPFDSMTEVGDSFLVPLDPADTAKEANKLRVRRLRQAALGASKRYAPVKFTVRVAPDEGGVRVHRVA